MGRGKLTTLQSTNQTQNGQISLRGNHLSILLLSIEDGLNPGIWSTCSHLKVLALVGAAELHPLMLGALTGLEALSLAGSKTEAVLDPQLLMDMSKLRQATRASRPACEQALE